MMFIIFELQWKYVGLDFFWFVFYNPIMDRQGDINEYKIKLHVENLSPQPVQPVTIRMCHH